MGQNRAFSFLDYLNAKRLDRIRSLFPEGDDLLMSQSGLALEDFSKLLEVCGRSEGAFGPRIDQARDAHMTESTAVWQT
jgi:hypothetical protein